jgi:predicted transposase/invertase (TIGR01784 family)
LSELLRRKIVIKNIVESEGNKNSETDKSNKVDIMVEADDKELVIIELQFDSQDDYFQRMLYGVSKTITEYISEGDNYSEVRKVYSINIVYFDLGKGDDYIYRGVTRFTGLHTHNELQLTEKQQKIYAKNLPEDLLPEYYIIIVRGFNDHAKNTLDQWVYYLKNNKIKDSFTAKGLDKAKRILAVDNLSDAEKKRYFRSIEERRIRDSEIITAYSDGEIKGEAIGLQKGEAIGVEKGREEGRTEERELTVINGHKAGHSLELIASFTGLNIKEITQILKKQNLI